MPAHPSFLAVQLERHESWYLPASTHSNKQDGQQPCSGHGSVAVYVLGNSEKARPQAPGNPKCLLDQAVLSPKRLEHIMRSLSTTQKNLAASGNLSMGFDCCRQTRQLAVH